jgi:hypothetical protein
VPVSHDIRVNDISASFERFGELSEHRNPGKCHGFGSLAGLLDCSQALSARERLHR